MLICEVCGKDVTNESYTYLFDTTVCKECMKDICEAERAIYNDFYNDAN